MPSYCRYPTVAGNTVVFVGEDDLWSVSLHGGVPRRITVGEGPASHPSLAPDGAWIAYTGHIDGVPEVCVVPTADSLGTPMVCG